MSKFKKAVNLVRKSIPRITKRTPTKQLAHNMQQMGKKKKV